MFATIIVLFISTLLGYILYAQRRAHKYFEEKGIKYIPGVPIFGNIFPSTFNKTHTVEDIDAVYRSFPNEKYVGFIEATNPMILIRDPEIIRMITVKNFDHFVDHKLFFPEEIEPLFGGSLLMMKGDKWKDMRNTLSPAFTSSKMRLMMPFMVEITSNIIEHLRDNIKKDIDVDDLMRRYTNDVIASTAFGVQVNSVKDKDNEFYLTGQNMFTFSILQNLLFYLSATFPAMFKLLRIQLFSRKYTEFFRNLVHDTMDYREKNNIVRPDMVQLLMEAAKGSLKTEKEDNELENSEHQLKHTVTREWTKNELASQVFIFFAAGFESSATALVLSIHELALNTEVQEKLYQEIKEHEEVNGKLTFENMSSLKYLDCVINETLRKWSPALIMDRECCKAYELPPPREGAKPVKLKPGNVVYNLVNSIHMDSKYYPNPEVFDPDRFSDDKRHIQPFTFMPFGMGPRNCIGLRFAMMEVRVLLYHLLLNFKILKCNKTADPIKLKPHAFSIKAKGGTWVQLDVREQFV